LKKQNKISIDSKWIQRFRYNLEVFDQQKGGSTLLVFLLSFVGGNRMPLLAEGVVDDWSYPTNR
jgi:hypothetical protein